MDIKIISLADTIGVSNKENITYLYENLIAEYPDVEFGAHLHSSPDSVEEKLNAAYEAGCRRFDGAIKGYGGCPMAKDELVGNIATEKIISHFEKKNINMGMNRGAFRTAINSAGPLFDTYH